MEETQSENKLFNIFLLGDIKSEKNKIIQQYILNNNEENIELEKENNKNESELTQSFEIHVETIRMKILEVSQIDQIFHSEKENSSQTHGILLFCNVSDRDSFDKLKEIISKIFDMNKYEIPIVLVGNNTNESQRKVSYEEAKNFSDNYGLKYYETSMENNFIKMKDIFRDLGEQVLYQDILDKNKNKNNEKELSIESYRNKDSKEIRTKPKVDIEKKTLLQKKREEEVREKRMKREKEMELWYKKKEREGIELRKKKAIEDKIKLKEKIREDKIIRKQREKEVKEEFYNEKKEKYEKSKRDKEEGEKKNILEKEKNKLIFEKQRKNEKENLKKLLLENEQNDKEYLKQKKSKILSPQSNKTRQKKNLDRENDQNFLFNTVTDFFKSDKRNKKESPTKNEKNKKILKSKSFRKITKKQHDKEEIEKTERKIKEIEISMEEIEKKEKKEKEEKLIQEQNKLKNELKENYFNYYCNIYRCLYCHQIPLININEFNHQIETYCNCKYTKNKNKVINNIFSYKYFEEKSLDHPIDNNLTCLYCKKSINELNNENINLNLCNLCNDIICSKDELIHKNIKHPNNKEIKEKYKNLTSNINTKKNEDKKQKISKNKSNENKNKSATLSKQNSTLKNRNQTQKKDKNVKEEKKLLTNRKNMASSNNIPTSNNKKNINKKGNDKNKIAEKNNINNNEEEEKNNIKKEEKEKEKEKEKVPIYLYDTCCFEHGIVYNNYCHDCSKNICSICEEKEHQNHNIEKFSDIMIDEEKLVNIKISLENDIKELNNISYYFNDLIEKIKEKYSYFYNLKKKEIEIKQKIIKDYEATKYNYNSIQNVNNITYKNSIFDKNMLISNLEKLNNNNNDILSELKLIFNYFNESSQTMNLLNYYNNINKLLIENGCWEISDIIKFNKDYIAISFYDGCLYIYDNKYFNLMINCKIFDNNKGISQIFKLNNGNLACCGYEKIIIVNMDLDNKTYKIINEINIKNGSFNLIEELKNNYLITYDTTNKLKIWDKSTLIYSYNVYNIDSLIKIKDNSFITSSKNTLNLYNINIDKNDSTKLNCFSLYNIYINNKKNSIIKLNDNYIIALVTYYPQELELNKFNFEECKNNEENNDNAICLIEIDKKNKLEIIQNIKNEYENGKYINIIKYINDSFLILNDLGIVELWNLDKINKKLFVFNKFKAIDNIYDKENINMIFIEDDKKIIFQDYKNIICLSHK